MNQQMDWSTGWTTSAELLPSIAEIENFGKFRKSNLTSRVFRIEVECNSIICEISLQLRPGADLNDLYANLNRHYRGEPFGIVQDMIDNAWEK